jgi:hypothetical protein
MRRLTLLACLLAALMLALAACGGDDDETPEPTTSGDATAEAVDATDTGEDTSGAPEAIEAFLQARVDSDEDALRDLSCVAREEQIEIDVASFQSVDASLDGVSCEVSGADGDYTLVSCDGQIVIDYGSENSELALGTYRAIREDDAWKMCGEG